MARVATVLLACCLGLPGCAGALARRPAVLHSAVVSRVQLLERDASPPVTGPRIVTHQRRFHRGSEGFAGGMSSSLASRPGRQLVVFLRGEPLASYDSRLSREGQPAGRTVWLWKATGRPTAWLATREGEPLNEVRPAADMGSNVDDLDVAWDASGERLAGWMVTESGLHIGLVDLATGRLQPLAHLPGTRVSPKSVPTLIWRGDGLILVCQTEDRQRERRNVILLVGPPGGNAKRLLDEPCWDPSLTAVRTALLSPDARLLAFDRTRPLATAASSEARGGIWLLDLESGECQEVTYEKTGPYHHQLVGWEGPDAIVFLRRVDEGWVELHGDVIRYERYRIQLRKTQTRSASSSGEE